MNKVYVCPALRRDCTWEGDITEIKNHFDDFHVDLLLKDHNSITLDSNNLSLNRILVYQSELYLIQTEWQPETGLLILRVRQPGPPNGVKYHLNVRNMKNANYVFSSKMTESGYKTVKVTNGTIEIDVGAIKLIAGSGQIIGGLEFEQQVRRRYESEQVSRKPSFAQCGSMELSSHLRKLFRTYSEYIEDSDDIDEFGLENVLKIQESGNYKDYIKSYVAFMHEQKSRLSFRSPNIDEDEYDSYIIAESEEDVKKREFDEQQRKELKDYEVKLATIQCSNCSRYMNPPIFVCNRGHSVCFYCQGDNCHKCGHHITDLSNTNLEDVSKSIPHPCRFTKQGCTRSIDYKKVHAHELRCEHHFYTCPDLISCSNAPFQYKFGEMISHLRLMHPSILTVNESRDVRFVKGSEFFLVNAEVGIFYCRARGIDGNSIEFNVYFCGARDTYFFCHLLILMKGGKGGDTFYLTRRGNLWYRTLSNKEIKDRKLKDKSIKLHILAH